MRTLIYEASGPFRNIGDYNRDEIRDLINAYGVDPMNCFRVVLVNDSAYFWTYDSPPVYLLYHVTKRPR